MQENPQVSTTPPLPGPELVDQVNNALQTVATDFAGPDEPNSLVWAFCTWADTGTGRWRRRNAANSAWVDLGPLFEESAAPQDGALYATQKWVTRKISEIGGKWAAKGIGELVAIWDHLPEAEVPPTDSPDFRYIKLSASDPYNAGVLASESVSGSAPLLTATAIISMPGSPLNGVLVYLINTERRAMRAGASGDLQDDAIQKFALRARRGSGSVGLSADALGSSDGSVSVGISSAGFYVETTATVVFDAPAGGSSVRTSTETRSRNIGATFFLRIK